MSLVATTDRIYVTNALGAVVLDTNRKMPHYIGTVGNSISVAFPACEYLGVGAVAIGRGGYTYAKLKYPSLDSTHVIGTISAATSLSCYAVAQIDLGISSEDPLARSYGGATWDLILYAEAGQNTCFSSIPLDFRTSNPLDGGLQGNVNTGITSWNPVPLTSYVSRLAEVYVANGVVYLRTRQEGVEFRALYLPPGYTTGGADTWSTYLQSVDTGPTYTFNINAQVGVRL